MSRHDVRLSDRYDLDVSPVLLNGTQALVRLMLLQKTRDRAAGRPAEAEERLAQPAPAPRGQRHRQAPRPCQVRWHRRRQVLGEFAPEVGSRLALQRVALRRGDRPAHLPHHPTHPAGILRPVPRIRP